MSLVGFPILRPLTFKCKILGQFESLKIVKDLYAGWQSLPPSSFFPDKSLLHFNISDLKIENLTNFIMLFPFLLSISYYYYFFMIDKVT